MPLDNYPELESPAWLDAFAAAEADSRFANPEAWAEFEDRFGPDFPREVLYHLTRKTFDRQRAQDHWRLAVVHRQTLSRALGRDVGLRTALADYFINIAPEVKQPLLVEYPFLAQKEQNAISDELTGLFNRRFFNNVLAKQVAGAQRYQQSFSLLMLDVDRFKRYNDRLGHPAGDRALAAVARLLQMCSRDIDYVVRYGGEEFTIILPLASKEQALVVAERHRKAMTKHRFPGGEGQPGGRLTLSIGVATFPEDASDALGLIAKADMALYEAKRRGRNRVEAAEPERRRHPRLALNAPASLRYLERDQEPLVAQTVDLSLSGVGLLASHPLEQGRPLELVIDLPQHQVRVTVHGQVVRVTTGPSQEGGYEVGVALDKASSSGQEYRALLEKRLGTLQ
ncbi:MAG: diguanylate cyclase [Pseudomonadota bacterium]